MAEQLGERLFRPVLSREQVLLQAANDYGISEQELISSLNQPPPFWQQVLGKRLVYVKCVTAVLLEHAVHELCANIIEHGYRRPRGSARDGCIDLWWIPELDLWDTMPPRDPRRLEAQTALSMHVHRSVLLVRDRGQAFSPSSRRASDLDDPAMRKRGRGLGLHIIQEVMHPVLYVQGTPHGNLTLMRFDPVQLVEQKEVRHVPTRR